MNIELKLRNIIKESLSKYIGEEKNIQKDIKHLRDVPQELKDEALKLLTSSSRAEKGKIWDLQIHPDITKKAKEHNVEIGFSMGIDKNGYFIYTHRARSKSHQKPSGISTGEMKKTNSTG